MNISRHLYLFAEQAGEKGVFISFCGHSLLLEDIYQEFFFLIIKALLSPLNLIRAKVYFNEVHLKARLKQIHLAKEVLILHAMSQIRRRLNSLMTETVII